jgi:hypothetical protein
MFSRSGGARAGGGGGGGFQFPGGGAGGFQFPGGGTGGFQFPGGFGGAGGFGGTGGFPGAGGHKPPEDLFPKGGSVAKLGKPKFPNKVSKPRWKMRIFCQRRRCSRP